MPADQTSNSTPDSLDIALAVLVITVKPEGHPRRVHARHELDGLGLDGRFVEGATGEDLDALALYSPRRNALFAKRSMSAQEIACYASHRRAWRALLASADEHALILEDDFHAIDPAALRRVLSDCIAGASRWDVVKFFEYSRKPVWRRKRLGSTELVGFKYPSSGAVGYLVSRKAASRLLSRERIFRPVDEDISWTWEFGLRIWSTPSNMVEDVSVALGGSQIELGRDRIKSWRNPLRPVWWGVLQTWKLVRATISYFGYVLEGRKRLPPEKPAQIVDRP